MDHAVSLVQTCLNGYFTSAEYPIIASARRNGVRTITDIDILAFRLPSGLPIANPMRKRAPQGLDVSELLDTGRHLQFKDPALGFLATLEKARRGHAGRGGLEGVEVVPARQPPRRRFSRRRMQRRRS
jgi:hypothetical protein